MVLGVGVRLHIFCALTLQRLPSPQPLSAGRVVYPTPVFGRIVSYFRVPLTTSKEAHMQVYPLPFSGLFGTFPRPFLCLLVSGRDGGYVFTFFLCPYPAAPFHPNLTLLAK